MMLLLVSSSSVRFFCVLFGSTMFQINLIPCIHFFWENCVFRRSFVINVICVYIIIRRGAKKEEPEH